MQPKSGGRFLKRLFLVFNPHRHGEGKNPDRSKKRHTILMAVVANMQQFIAAFTIESKIHDAKIF
jgi:hypothetical protein